MAVTTDDDRETVADAEPQAPPEEAASPRWLTAFFSRRAASVHQPDADGLALELSGVSAHDLMIFAVQDPSEKRRRAEEDRRRAALAEEEKAGSVVYHSAGDMADFGDEYTISTVPAFTEAAANVVRETAGNRSGTERGTSLDMKKALRPSGQGAPKPG